jgi:hypothetical protein
MSRRGHDPPSSRVCEKFAESGRNVFGADYFGAYGRENGRRISLSPDNGLLAE